MINGVTYLSSWPSLLRALYNFNAASVLIQYNCDIGEEKEGGD